jgi:hypothetical protein
VTTSSPIPAMQRETRTRALMGDTMTRIERGAEIDLHIGRRYTGVSVRPDFEWPGMWRVHQGDRTSGMANLSRAKDAAIIWVRPRGLGSSEVARWHRRETAPDASNDALARAGATCPPSSNPLWTASEGASSR